MIDRDWFFCNMVTSLQEIAGQEFQEKGWVRGELYGRWSFSETYCSFFEAMDGIEASIQIFGLSRAQMRKLSLLRCALENYPEVDDAFIIEDPTWHKIREMAIELLCDLHADHDFDPSKSIPKACLMGLLRTMQDQTMQEQCWIEKEKQGRRLFAEFVEKFFLSSNVYEIVNVYRDYGFNDE